MASGHNPGDTLAERDANRRATILMKKYRPKPPPSGIGASGSARGPGKRAWGADTINIQKSNDPFGSDKKSREQADKFKPGNPKHTSMWKNVARAVAGAHFPDDSYRNQLQKAQAGLLKKIDPKGLSPSQMRNLRSVVAGRSHGP